MSQYFLAQVVAPLAAAGWTGLGLLMWARADRALLMLGFEALQTRADLRMATMTRTRSK